MSDPVVDDEVFMRDFREIGPQQMGFKYKTSPRNIYARRKNLEKKYGIRLDPPNGSLSRRPTIIQPPERNDITIKNGVVLIISDLHLWPGVTSSVLRAFIKFCKELSPAAVILNGDVLDFPQISRHPPINWEELPSVQEEIEYAQDIVSQVELAAPKAQRHWPAGNHDLRFETRLAVAAPEFAKINGVHLHDHFPLWRTCYSVFINNTTVVKHRFKGGIHATHNNTIWAGISVVTGNLHSAKVTPFSDYNGTRYGMDTGCGCNPNGPQFRYTEDNPKNWREAFGVLTYSGGQLMYPELVLKWDENHVQFRGQLIKV